MNLLTHKQIGRVVGVSNQPAGTTSITLALPIEVYRLIQFSQTAAGATVILPNPSDTSTQFAVDLANTGSQSIFVTGVGFVAPGNTVRALWTGTAYVGPAFTAIMGGASIVAAGSSGGVPAPAINEQAYTLRGDGTWRVASQGNLGSVANGTALVAATHIDVRDVLAINNTVALTSYTLPVPTTVYGSKFITVSNSGTQPMIVVGMTSIVIPVNNAAQFVYQSGWRCLGRPPSIAAKKSVTVAQTIANNTQTVLTLPTTVINNGFDASSANAILIPVNGVYRLSAQTAWANNATGARSLYIAVDGVRVVEVRDAPTTALGAAQHVDITLALAANQSITALVSHTRGVALDTAPSAITPAWLSVEMI